ncbi:MAG: DUF5703 domain-containing protein [Luteolibacter sp.]
MYQRLLPIPLLLWLGASCGLATTTFNGGSLYSAAQWSNGLPTVGNDGSITTSGTFAGNVNFNVATAGTVTVGHGSGTLTGDSLNLRNDAAGGATYQWNQYGGSVTCSFVVVNNRVTYTLVGGTVSSPASPTGGARVQIVNSGVFNQTGGTLTGLAYDFGSNTTSTHRLTGGSGVNIGSAWTGAGVWVFRVANLNTVKVSGDWSAAFRSSTTAEYVIGTTGILDFQSSWTGSLTNPGFAGGTGWKTVLTQTGVQVAGSQVTSANFDSLFRISPDGTAVSLIQPVDTSPQPLVDLSTYDVLWTTHGTGEADNMPLGNGRTGANVWVTPDGNLELYLSHNDAVSELHRLLKLGKLSIALSPSPFGKDKPIRQKLVLRGGRIELTAGIPGQSVSLQLWMDSDSDVLHLTGTSEIPRSVTVNLINWRNTQRTLGTSELASTWNYRTGVQNGAADWESADTIKTDPAGLMWYHRNAYSSLPFHFQQQGLSASLPNFTDPLENRASGVLLSGTGFTASDPLTLTSSSPLTNIDLRAVVKVSQTATAGDWESGVQTALANDVTTQASRTRTATWWENYWQTSWIFAEEAPARVVPLNAKPLRMGADQSGGNRSGGNVAGITTMASCLTDSQVAALATSSPTTPPATLPAGWSATAPAVADASGITLNTGWLQYPSDDANTLFNRDFTLAAWIKPTSLGCRIFDKITPGGSDGMLFDTYSGLRFITGNHTIYGTTTLQTNVWQHVACTVSADRKEVSLYLNGALVTRQSWSDGLPGYPVTRAYTLTKLLSAMQMRGETPAHFQGGIFTVDPKIAYYATDPNTFSNTPDYRFYGCSYWWQNARLLYMPLLAQGWTEPVRTFIDFYASKRSLFNDCSQHYYGAQGIYFQETVNLAGLPGMGDYGWNATQYSESYTRNIWQQPLELAVLMQDYYDQTGDENFLQQTLLPWANDTLKFFDTRFSKSSGIININPSHGLETYWTGVTNDMPSVAGLHAVTDWLLKLPTAKVAPADRTTWARISSQLPPIPKRVVNGVTVPDNAAIYNSARSNYESPDLYSVHPFRIYGLNRTTHDIAEARQGFLNMPDVEHSCWNQYGMLAARLGKTDAAKDDITQRAAYRMARNDKPGSVLRFPGYFGSPHDWSPDFDGPGNLMSTFQEMILQPGPDNTLLLAGAWPSDWNASFKLHAAGGTTITGTIRNGAITQLATDPPQRIADVRLIGTLPVSTTATSNPYDAWRLNHFPGRDAENPALGLDTADPDGDGIPNSKEYAANTDPRDGSSIFHLRTTRTPSGEQSLDFTAEADRSYTIETSTDMTHWLLFTTVPAQSSAHSVSIGITTSESRRFYRAITSAP